MWRLSTRHWVEVGRIRMKLARLNDNRLFLVLGVIALLTSCSRRTPAAAEGPPAAPGAAAPAEMGVFGVRGVVVWVWSWGRGRAAPGAGPQATPVAVAQVIELDVPA